MFPDTCGGDFASTLLMISVLFELANYTHYQKGQWGTFPARYFTGKECSFCFVSVLFLFFFFLFYAVCSPRTKIEMKGGKASLCFRTTTHLSIFNINKLGFNP